MKKKPEVLEIIKAKRAGFCFGVKRAMDTTFEIAQKKGKGVFTLGPIIHNPQVIEELKKEGILSIGPDEIGKSDIEALIIRTHGIPRDLHERISRQGLKIIDATCPFVKKAQHYAKLLKEKGYQVIILGDIDHPEVKGLMSYAGEDAVVVSGDADLTGIKSKVGIIVQTTQPVDALKRLLSAVVEHAVEMKVFNTICNSTALRLKETAEMARRVDAMVVVGGKNSANTTQLAGLCKSLCGRTYHIETSSELEPGWFEGVRKVGITAGASTPDWIIEQVEKRIRDIGGKSRNGN